MRFAPIYTANKAGSLIVVWKMLKCLNYSSVFALNLTIVSCFKVFFLLFLGRWKSCLWFCSMNMLSLSVECSRKSVKWKINWDGKKFVSESFLLTSKNLVQKNSGVYFFFNFIKLNTYQKYQIYILVFRHLNISHC